MAGYWSIVSNNPVNSLIDNVMKKLNLICLLSICIAGGSAATPAYSHVIPEDELRNQVYLTTNEALKKVFEGVRKIKREKHKVSSVQKNQIEKTTQQQLKSQRIEFYTARAKNQKIYATIGKASANSHPVTEAKFVVLIDSQGLLKDIHIMEYRGPQRAEIISRAFLDQYLSKSAESDFSTVTSNQGLTLSTQALNQAVLKILILYKVLYIDSTN
jgi:hypothetical protein